MGGVRGLELGSQDMVAEVWRTWAGLAVKEMPPGVLGSVAVEATAMVCELGMPWKFSVLARTE